MELDVEWTLFLLCVGFFSEQQAVRQVAAELVRIADNLNDAAVAQAAAHLNMKLSNSSKPVSLTCSRSPKWAAVRFYTLYKTPVHHVLLSISPHCPRT